MRGRSVLRGILLLVAIGAIAAGCGPTYPECNTDEHCADYDEVCVNGFCKQCRDDSQCNADDSCKVCGVGNVCVTAPGCCHNDLDCPNGVCRMSGPDKGQCFGNCKDSTQCPSDQECKGNMCVPKAECTGPGQCGPDKECMDGRCIDKCKPELVYFEYNESRIRSEYKAVLEAGIKCLKERNQDFAIEGHCDERGTDEYNLALGSKRAKAVLRYLKRLDIPESLMSMLSYGEERPVCGGHSEDCWQRNRRTEFTFK